MLVPNGVNHLDRASMTYGYGAASSYHYYERSARTGTIASVELVLARIAPGRAGCSHLSA